MAFGKKQLNTETSDDRFDLNNADDRLEVIAFEKELEPYLKETRSVFGQTLKGYELYLHEKGLFCYSTKYPDGAIRNLSGYRLAEMKYHALGQLQDLRGRSKSRDDEAFDALLGSEQMAMV